MPNVWGGVVCDNEHSRSAVLSWFKPFVPEAWGLPLKCDLQTDYETDREIAMRALFRTPDGRLKEAVRKRLATSMKYITRDASPGILKDWRPPAELSANSPAEGRAGKDSA